MLDFRVLSRALGLLAVCACTGSLGDGRPPGAPPAPAPSGGGPATGGGPGPGGGGGERPVAADPMAAAACSQVKVAPGVSRLLTSWEHAASVRDLVGLPLSLPELPKQPSETGFDNEAARTSIAAAHVEKLKETAEAVAREAVAKALPKLLGGCDPKTAGDDACLAKLYAGFARQAYRRPLGDDERAVLKKAFDAGKATDFATGVQLVVQVVLQSPQFLYRVEAPVTGVPVRVPQAELATRLSYLVWGTGPDEALLEAAAAGKLATKEQIAAQVERMWGDAARARAAMTHFTSQWLELEKIAKAEKDAKAFPAWKSEHLALWKTEIESFVDHVIWKGEGDFGTLFTAKYTFVDETLGKVYGFANAPKNAGGVPAFTKVDVDGVKRGGVLTQAGLLAMEAHANQTSPVLRGKFVRERLLCDPLPPPPPDLVIELPPVSPDQTTRERFTVHKEKDACRGCHALMDPLGLGFERYDAVGAYRETENGKPIDDSGEIVGVPDGTGIFKGPIELGRKLAASEKGQACFVKQAFRYAFGRTEKGGVDDCTMAFLESRFRASGYKVKDLVLAITETDTFLYKGGTP